MMAKFNKLGKKEKKHLDIVGEETVTSVDEFTQPVAEATDPVSSVESQVVSKEKRKPKHEGLTQREGVYQEVMRVIAEQALNFDPTQSVKPLLTGDHLKQIYGALAAGFQSRQIFIKDTESNQKKLGDPKLLELYIVGLVNNWLKRDKRLNGEGEVKA